MARSLQWVRNRAAALAVLAALVLGTAGARAGELSSEQAALFEAMGLPEILEVMRAEGVAYGTDLEGSFFPGRGGAAWQAMVEDIHDLDTMRGMVESRFAEEMGGTDIAPLLAFFRSDLGRRIVSLEVSARRALRDPDIEAAAGERFAEMLVEEDARAEVLRAFVETNDLVGYNVMGAMNSSYAFFLGMMDGAAFDDTLTEEQILSDVWGQEEEIRSETEDWVYSYLAMAYQPLSDAEISAYTELSRTPEGRALNRALFAAFDDMYNALSRALGRATAFFMGAQDL